MVSIDVIVADVEQLIKHAAMEHPNDTLLRIGLDRVLRMLQVPEPDLPKRPAVVQVDRSDAW